MLPDNPGEDDIERVLMEMEGPPSWPFSIIQIRAT